VNCLPPCQRAPCQEYGVDVNSILPMSSIMYGMELRRIRSARTWGSDTILTLHKQTIFHSSRNVYLQRMQDRVQTRSHSENIGQQTNLVTRTIDQMMWEELNTAGYYLLMKDKVILLLMDAVPGK